MSQLPPRYEFLANLLQYWGEQRSELLAALCIAAGVFDLQNQENKSSFVALSGISSEKLDKIVALGKQAKDDNSPRRKKQHLVSQVLLRNFGSVKMKNTKVLIYLLEKRTTNYTSSSKVAAVNNLVAIDSEATENLWSCSEQSMKGILKKIDSREPKISDADIKTIKQFVVLHVIRSLEVFEKSQELWSTVIESVPKQMSSLNWSEILSDKHHLHPPDDSFARKYFIDLVVAFLNNLRSSGVLFRLRIADLFQQASLYAETMELKLYYVPCNSEFLIGDSPAIQIDRNGLKHGITEGVPLANSENIVLPLSPKCTAMISKDGGTATISHDYVECFNKLQINNARHSIVLPSDNLVPLIEQERFR